MTRLAALLVPTLLAAEGIVVDRVKGYMWQDIPFNKEILLDWHDAKDHCERLYFYGHDDWWLPTEDQLVTIVDMKRRKGRRIRQGFRFYEDAPYWTATTYAFNAPHAWYVNFYDGFSRSVTKDRKFFVRCVRRLGKEEKR